MRWIVVFARTAALVIAVSSLASRADCAFATAGCLGSDMFSYFTVHSILLLILAVVLAGSYTAIADREPRWLTVLRGLATTYIVASGAVFAALIANAKLFEYLFLVPLSSKVLHFVLPLYAVADFLLAPHRHRLRWSTAWLAMVFPVIWAGYTMVRGELIGWYPYFFLDPARMGGYGVVCMYALGLSGVILLTALLTVATTRLPTTPRKPFRSAAADHPRK